MKFTINQIVPGKILYVVYGVGRRDCKNARLDSKIIVTSKPYTCKDIERPKFDYLYKSEITGKDMRGNRYTNDCGLGDNIYNLNRLFSSLEDALDFIEQCKTGVFKEKSDQDFYDNDYDND